MNNENVYDASMEAAMEERSQLNIIRDPNDPISINGSLIGRISSYDFRILVRDKPDFVGSLSREEADLMFRLYSKEGANLTQRNVSRHFPRFTFPEFKKILRAFQLVKDSIPFAPHILEEKSNDNLVEMTLHYKENNFLKKLEEERNQITEKSLKDMTRKYYDLKRKSEDFQTFLSDLKLDVVVEHIKPKNPTNITLVVYLSDMHIGASVSGDSIYPNPFNKEEAEKRMKNILQWIISNASLYNASNIIICNIGDSLDGYDGQTTRGGHSLPQNMNNKDQFRTFLQLMTSLFSSLSSCGLFNSIKYYAVDGGNHDGDFGWGVNMALESTLSITNPNIQTKVYNKFMGHFSLDSHTFILCHGKDAKDMFKNFPLTINDKTENQINEFIDFNNISGNIHFIKGDLHQSATTYGKKFRYKSVSSFFGSSEWIHKNFGNTKAACDMDVICDNNIYETRLVLN